MYKRLVFLLVTLLSLKISAQELTVFAINGSAERLQGKDWKSLVKGQPLQGSDRVRTSPQGSLTLLDNERRKVYAVQSAQGGTVEALVGTQRARAKSMTAEAFAEVKKAMFSQPDDRYATRGGVTYRGGNADEQLAAWLDAHITSSFNIQNSSFTVALHATDPATHKAVRSVGVGGTVELLVVNESDEALHVSVLDVDAEGVWSAVSEGCELMPPHAAVVLPYPIEFFEPRGTDHLLLVAYPEVFDPQRVVALRDNTTVDGKTVEAGAAVIKIEIR
ncbi:MAG: hypothetical protein IKN51_05430 [Bacteroidaceae bacterium]|nr:hypothetical protein [Bacteroidaceae bacterium]